MGQQGLAPTSPLWPLLAPISCPLGWGERRPCLAAHLGQGASAPGSGTAVRMPVPVQKGHSAAHARCLAASRHRCDSLTLAGLVRTEPIRQRRLPQCRAPRGPVKLDTGCLSRRLHFSPPPPIPAPAGAPIRLGSEALAFLGH